MPYSRPAYNTADATFNGAAYTRPAFTAANATFSDADPETIIAVSSMLGDAAVLSVVSMSAIVAADSMLGAVELLGVSQTAIITAASMLGAASVLATVDTNFVAGIDSPLGAVAILGHSDYSDAVDYSAPVTYALDLITPSGAVRVPISSWQAALQVTNQSYAGAVIPHCADWLATIDVATEFVIYRQSTLLSGQPLEQEIVRSPLDTVQTDQGPANHTASISGYGDAYLANASPDAIYDRTLRDVRSLSVYVTSGVRTRCAIDWLLRPGQRAFYSDAASMVVSYINMYSTNSGDEYMDVGERLL